MDGITRRPSGVYIARLVVPPLLRGVVGKTELLKSTGTHNVHVAKVVGAEILAHWRRWLHNLACLSNPSMDIERVALGHPTLSLGGHLGLSAAAAASGLDRLDLLRAAADQQLNLHVQASAWQGHILPEASLETEPFDTGRGLEVPAPDRMPPKALSLPFSGLLRVHHADIPGVAAALSRSEPATLVLFDLIDQPGHVYVPDEPRLLTELTVLVSVSQVEVLRSKAASVITSDQLAKAQTQAAAVAASESHAVKARMPVSEAAAAYMKVRRLNCNDEQARRIQGALNLFVELTGDPRIGMVSTEVLEHYRDNLLPLVPGNENKIRLQHGSTSIAESIAAVEGMDWPRISVTEQVKRLQWLSGMFAWLVEKKWLPSSPASGLVRESRAKATARKDAEREQDARQLFGSDHLQKIFSAGSWFITGRGTRTKEGTYREFAPHYFWLPLLGLYTGARINELAQLHLTDIKRTESGTAYFELALLDDDEGKKKRKNANSKRSLPIHPHLLKLGFLLWCERLAHAGYNRVFPELKHDPVKGYGKAATNWFSRYLFQLGWPRDGKLVFHSFRSTLVNACVRNLRLTLVETAQITGHREGLSSTLARHYVKDSEIDELMRHVERLDFDLPPIACFDAEAGLQAVKDALRRKNRGSGGIED